MSSKIIKKSNFTNSKIIYYEKKFSESKPFPHIIIDNFLEKKFIEKILENFKLNKNWINYSLVNNYKKFGLNDRKKMSKDLNLLFNELNSKKFLKNLTKITKIKNIFLDKTLDGGGIHQIFKGGHLNIHTDFASHTKQKKWKRVLNILIYLNKKWKKKYNGNLEFWSNNGKNKVKEIVPKFNRCVLFLTNEISYHGHPKKLNCPENISRKSIAVYYFVKQKKALKLRPTKYISLPTDKLSDRFLINFDRNLNNLYSFLKRNNILDDKSATKILNLFLKKN